jgi:hypothetical protein
VLTLAKRRLDGNNRGVKLQEEVEFLRAENAQPKKQLAEMLATTGSLERRIAALEGRGKPPPFVKANKPKPVGEK